MQVFLDVGDESNKFVNLEGVPQWYSLCPPDRNLPSLPSPQPPYSHGTIMRKVKAIANNTSQNFGSLTKRRKERKGLGAIIGAEGPALSLSLQDIASAKGSGSKSPDVPSLLEPLKDRGRGKKISLPDPPLRRPSSSRSRKSNNRNSLLSLFEWNSRRDSIAEEEPNYSFSFQKMGSSPMLDVNGDASPNSKRGNLSLVEFLDGLNTPRTKAKLLKLSHGLRQKSFSQDVLDVPRPRRPLSLSSDSMNIASEDSSFGSGSETSSITSVNKPTRLLASGWSTSSSEDMLRPPSSALSGEFSPPPQSGKSVLRHYSFLDSLEDMMDGVPLESPTQLLRRPSKLKKSSARRKSSMEEGYDHLLPFLKINDSVPFSPHSLSSSTETLTPHVGAGEEGSKLRSSSWTEIDTSPSPFGRSLMDSRLSRSVDELSEMRSWSQYDDSCTQSSLDLSDSSSSRGQTQSQQDSDLLTSIQPIATGADDSIFSNGLESIMERSMEDSVQVETLKRSKKRSVSLEMVASESPDDKGKYVWHFVNV